MGAEICYEDRGTAPVWSFQLWMAAQSDAREGQMLFLGDKGRRCITRDRRSHGPSSPPWDSNGVNTCADDLVALSQKLYLKNAVRPQQRSMIVM
jgi:non-heme chloroperoxidase